MFTVADFVNDCQAKVDYIIIQTLDNSVYYFPFEAFSEQVPDIVKNLEVFSFKFAEDKEDEIAAAILKVRI